MDFRSVSNLDDLNPKLAASTMRAGWNKKEPSLWAEPRTAFKPVRWTWAAAREALDVASQWISPEQAERRNLFMVNPAPDNHYATLRTLVSAYQMIRPGEEARSHRHSPNALRLILEAQAGAFTVVDGERIDMEVNDVVLTPGGCWHGHGNDGEADAYWVDYLDVPTVHLLEPMFLEHHPDGFERASTANVTRDLAFRWRDVQPALAARLDAASGGMAELTLEAPSLPTLLLQMLALRAGAATPAVRSTENQVITVVEGTGHTMIDGERFTWSRGDVLAIPTWKTHRHVADGPAVLFRVSDRQMQQKLGFFHLESV